MLTSTWKYSKKHFRKIGIVVTLLGVVFFLCFAIRQRSTTNTLVGFPLEKNKGSLPDSRKTEVELMADEFNPANFILSGTVRVTVSPNKAFGSDGMPIYPEGEPQHTLEMKNAILSLRHREYLPEGPDIVEQGSSDAVKLEHTPEKVVAGNGKFTWRAQSVRSTFWYPFDRFVLNVNPILLVSTGGDEGVERGLYEENIEIMQVDLRAPNLNMTVSQKQVSDPRDDHYEIEFKRPLVLRTITIFIGLLAILWLVYLAIYADPGSYVGQILTFFLGLWGVRTTLLAGLSGFPVMLDYLTLTLAMTAVGFVISGWAQERLMAEPSRTTVECPHCSQKIPCTASRCPFCTSNL